MSAWQNVWLLNPVKSHRWCCNCQTATAWVRAQTLPVNRLTPERIFSIFSCTLQMIHSRFYTLWFLAGPQSGYLEALVITQTETLLTKKQNRRPRFAEVKIRHSNNLSGNNLFCFHCMKDMPPSVFFSKFMGRTRYIEAVSLQSKVKCCRVVQCYSFADLWWFLWRKFIMVKNVTLIELYLIASDMPCARKTSYDTFYTVCFCSAFYPSSLQPHVLHNYFLWSWNTCAIYVGTGKHGRSNGSGWSWQSLHPGASVAPSGAWVIPCFDAAKLQQGAWVTHKFV